MLYTPDSHLYKQIDQLKENWFGRYMSICDPTLRGGCHRMLTVAAITVSSLWTDGEILYAGACLCRGNCDKPSDASESKDIREFERAFRPGTGCMERTL